MTSPTFERFVMIKGDIKRRNQSALKFLKGSLRCISGEGQIINVSPYFSLPKKCNIICELRSHDVAT